MAVLQISNNIPLLTPVLSSKGVRRLRLMNDYKVYIDSEKDRYVIVPTGSETNFASIPWMFRWAVSPTDPVLVLPSVVHDYLTGEFDRKISKPVIYSEKLSGKIVDHHVDWFEAATIFKYLIRTYEGKAVMSKSNVAYAAVWIQGYLRKIKFF